MGNQSEHGQSIYWKPSPVELPPYLASDKALVEPMESAGRSCTTLMKANEAVKAASNNFKNLTQMHRNRDPRKTAIAHLESVSSEAQRTGKRVRDGLGKIMEELTSKRAQILDEVERNLKINPGASEHSAEMRSVLRGMNDRDRNTTLTGAIENGDYHVVGAVLETSGMLSGVSEDLRGSLKNKYIRKHAPEDMQHVSALEKARDRVWSVIEATIEVGAQLETLPEGLAQQVQQHDEIATKFAAQDGQ